MPSFPTFNTSGVMLEAEVAPSAQPNFEARYQKATRKVVSPGNPVNYQDQPNKWGAELRVYFNDAKISNALKKVGVHVEHPREGYKSGEFAYRANNNDLWWHLVEARGLVLGTN